jgi:pimeloyl-ACP methyl ester carboxylesterase
VHGAWHGGWCWERLTRELEGRGHEVGAPDLPCDEVGLTQHDYANIVGPQPDAVVVGHSLGGLTVALVEARLRVYLAGIMPLGGDYDRVLQPGFGGFRRDGLDRSYWTDLETASRRLYPDCDRETAAWAFERLRPQARLEAHEGEIGAADAAIACRRDVAVRPDSFTGVVARVVELDAGHFPMLTHPRELADAIEELALVRASRQADQ